MLPVKFEALYDDVKLPARGTAWSAGYDLCAYIYDRSLQGYDRYNESIEISCRETALVKPGERVMVPCGFKMTMPEEYEAQVRPRSGTAFKQALVPVNSPGTIDSDFAGEIAVLLVNQSDAVVEITHLERIAQLVFAKHEVVEFVPGVVAQVTDRVGGFGSTGQ